jgi:hypothetical protein
MSLGNAGPVPGSYGGSSVSMCRWARAGFRPRGLLLLVLSLSSSVLSGQEQSGSQNRRNQVEAPQLLRTAQAIRVENGPKLDGTLNDPSWLKTTPISNFLQREPFEGQTPTEKTEVRVLYTKHEVYFGIACFGLPAAKDNRDGT